MGLDGLPQKFDGCPEFSGPQCTISEIFQAFCVEVGINLPAYEFNIFLGGCPKPLVDADSGRELIPNIGFSTAEHPIVKDFLAEKYNASLAAIKNSADKFKEFPL